MCSIPETISKITPWNPGHTSVFRLLCTRPKQRRRMESKRPQAHERQQTGTPRHQSVRAVLPVSGLCFFIQSVGGRGGYFCPRVLPYRCPSVHPKYRSNEKSKICKNAYETFTGTIHTIHVWCLFISFSRPPHDKNIHVANKPSSLCTQVAGEHGKMHIWVACRNISQLGIDKCMERIWKEGS